MNKLLKDIRGVFLSVRTTIFLLISIALVSIVGTIIPQQKEIDLYIDQYGETLYHLFDLLGFFNIFGSWWFQLLLVLFITNLVVCSLHRVPKVWSLRNQNRREWLGRLGPPITHLSLIIILTGSLIGNVWGFKGYVNIPQGESRRAIMVNGSGQTLDLDFAIRCDRFEVTYYPGSEMPKEYVSDLAILEKDREVLRKTIQVNDPLRYKGISFYQSSYGVLPPQPGERKAELEIIPKGNGSRGYRLQIGEGEIKDIPKTGHSVQFATFVPDFSLDKENRIISRSNEPRNPAVQVKIYQNGKLLFNGWSFLRYPDFHGSRDDTYRVKFLNYSDGGKPYTGLMVVKDPGVWVVWTGFSLLVLGLFLSFYFRRRSNQKGGIND